MPTLKSATTQVRVVPEKLCPGDTIGIVAPAGCFNIEKFEKGIDVLKEMGFEVKIPQGVFARHSYFAGDDLHRAGLVNQMFGDPDIKALMCARGGFGCLRILPLLDFDTIYRYPKIFMGFSDITALLAMIYQKSHFAVYHSPNVTTMAEASDITRQSLFDAVCGSNPVSFYLEQGTTVVSGQTIAPVIGGNLTTLCHMIGTPYAPNFEGHILFLEDRGEALYRIDRMLSQMKLAGSFKGLAGVILGTFDDCGPIETVCELIKNSIDDPAIPVLAGFEIGHGVQNKTLPIGMTAELDADRHTLIYQVDTPNDADHQTWT